MGEKKEKKEKPLEKMKATELRDAAKTIEGITGVHGMNKPELLEVIRKARGIETQGKQADVSCIRDSKGKIRNLKKQREEAAVSGDATKVTRLRLRINRLKKKVRRAAA